MNGIFLLIDLSFQRPNQMKFHSEMVHDCVHCIPKPERLDRY